MLGRLLEHPRPSAAAIDKARRMLDAALGPSKVLVGPSQCEPYAADDSDFTGPIPDAVVLASSTEDIARTLAVAAETGVPVTPRGAGSGRTGGSVPLCGGIVLATLGMNSIKEIDRADRVAVVEPGLITGDLHDAVEREGLFYPPDPNSLKMCAMGGNVAENAGGPRAFKYGVTRDYVLGLEAVLVGGTRIRTGKRTVKGVTGYDVTALLTGSEGTLAVFGEITVRLLEKPPSVTTLLALFSDVRKAAIAVGAIVSAGLVPRCIELLDRGTLDAVRKRGNPIDERAGAMLLIETDGDERACDEQAERVGEACVASGSLDVLVAQDASQRARLWAARREMSPAVRALARHKLSEDVVVPRKHIADLLDRVGEYAASHDVHWLTYGHAGDGNMHVNFLWNDDDERPKIEKAIEQLFRDVVSMKGTLSGEHGIGISKAPYLALEQSAELIGLQRRIKDAFDPKCLLNPGKIFPPAGHGAC